MRKRSGEEVALQGFLLSLLLWSRFVDSCLFVFVVVSYHRKPQIIP